MATYVDGFVLVVPKEKRAAYKKMAKEGAKTWLKFGAIDYKECRADDMSMPGITFTFPKMMKAKPNEEVWFSFIVFKSKADRKAVNRRVHAYFGEKYADNKDPMPFDMKRMAVGGFSTEVEG